MVNKKLVAVVAGAGPGNGAALARRFSAAGYAVALLARHVETLEPMLNQLVDIHGYVCDVGDAASVATAFAKIESELGPTDVLLYNAGSGVFGDIEKITPDDFEQAWRVNAFGALLCARAVMDDMKTRGRGAIIFIGATASRRGGLNAAAFAPAKAAQRSLAESMARKLWPAGVHVALIVVDGIVDLPRTRIALPGKPDDAFVDPDGVAEIAWQLCAQRKRAWSFEVEARPFGETW